MRDGPAATSPQHDVLVEMLATRQRLEEMRHLASAVILLTIVGAPAASPQSVQIPGYYVQDQHLSDSLSSIVHSVSLDSTFDVGENGGEQISLAVIDLTEGLPKYGGVHAENVIYPASVYKMYVAAEILHQVSEGKYALSQPIVVAAHNAVDGAKEVLNDPRPLLLAGDTVTVNYLLDLMITRSDNSAANCLIDKAGRGNINRLLHDCGWYGSEVTRKFLKRRFEDAGYDTVRGTETCALHAADFLYRITLNRLVNPWVSQQMKVLLGRQLDASKLSPGLPPGTMFYHKTGWFSFWTNDVGIVDNGRRSYIIACFVPVREEEMGERMKNLSRRVFDLIGRLHTQ
jgi:beta-lactamase class A